MVPPSSPLAFTRRQALRTFAFTLGATALPGAFGFLAHSAIGAGSPSPSPAASAPPVTSTPLGGKLQMIAGFGGNIIAMGGDDGALVVDSGLPTVTKRMTAEVAKSGAVAMVVNTHWHYDHAGGNEALARAGARVIAHENCRRRMSTEQFVEALNIKQPPSPAGALPRVTFNSETTLHTNGDVVRLVPVAPAHTDGDVVVVFQNAEVIHAGDLFFNGMYPFIDYSSGGWIGGMVEAIRTIVSMTGAQTRIVPGHGRLATPDDLKSYLEMLETMHERFEKLKAEGKTVDEVVAAAPSKDLDERFGKGFMNPEKFVRFAYTSLLKRG